MLIYKLRFKFISIVKLVLIITIIFIPYLYVNKFKLFAIENIFYFIIIVFIFGFYYYQSFELHENYLQVNPRIWQIYSEPIKINIKIISEITYNTMGSTARLRNIEIKVVEYTQKVYKFNLTILPSKDVRKLLDHLQRLGVNINIIRQ
jgi:hypothetical protein